MLNEVKHLAFNIQNLPFAIRHSQPVGWASAHAVK
jgi:hypothetical protein